MYNRYPPEYKREGPETTPLGEELFTNSGPVASFFAKHFPDGCQLVASDINTNVWEAFAKFNWMDEDKLEYDEGVTINNVEYVKVYHLKAYTVGNSKFMMVYADLYNAGSPSGIWDIVSDHPEDLKEAFKDFQEEVARAKL